MKIFLKKMQNIENQNQTIRLLLHHLEEVHKCNQEEILNAARHLSHESSIKIPVSIFSSKLGALESVTLYLRDHLDYSNKETAKLLNRDPRSVWTSYNNAKKKNPKKIKSLDTDIQVPISIFIDRSRGPQEALVSYLVDHLKLSLHKIAVLLKRDDSTIWTAYNRRRGHG